MFCVGIKNICAIGDPNTRKKYTVIEKRFNLNGWLQAVRYHTPTASNVH